jgi:hypothetical protein
VGGSTTLGSVGLCTDSFTRLSSLCTGSRARLSCLCTGNCARLSGLCTGSCTRLSSLCTDTFTRLSSLCIGSYKEKIVKCILLLLLALQPTVGFSLLSNFLPVRPFLTQLSPPSYTHYLYILFNVLNPSFPWSSSVSPTYWLSSVLQLEYLQYLKEQPVHNTGNKTFYFNTCTTTLEAPSYGTSK